ncbi:MAG: NUDIX domain-containing protein [Candidatus Diapherotrites archaeon]
MEDKFRHAIFGVAYCKNADGEIEYILLKRKKHWIGWEFPKGKIERFETKKMAVKREVGEETGLKVIRIKKFREKGKYLYKKKLKDRPGKIGQTYQLFAVEVKKGKIKLDAIEHNGYQWAFFKKAYKKLTWPNQKHCLKIVDDWLNKNY